MVEAFVGGDFKEGMTSAGLGVGGRVYDTRHASLHNGPGAHGAGFECDVERAIDEPPGTERFGRLGNGDHLSVRGWVMKHFPLIEAFSDDATVIGGIALDHHGADGNFVRVERFDGQVEGVSHPTLVRIKRIRQIDHVNKSAATG